MFTIETLIGWGFVICTQTHRVNDFDYHISPQGIKRTVLTEQERYWMGGGAVDYVWLHQTGKPIVIRPDDCDHEKQMEWANKAMKQNPDKQNSEDK